MIKRVGLKSAEFLLTCLCVAAFVTTGETLVCWWLTRERD